MIDRLTEMSKTKKLSDLFRAVIEDTGYMAMLEAAGITEIDRVQNVKELVSNAVTYEEANPDTASLSGFLEEVALISDIDNYDAEADAVVLMTIHSAKGLEFPVVFLPGMEEGLFPSMQSAMDPSELEEERRLAYVAITRAKERLYLLHARERLIYGKTNYNQKSRFIEEIPEEYINLPLQRKLAEAAAANAQAAAQANERRKKPLDWSRETFRAADLISGVGKTHGHERFSTGDRVFHYTFHKGTVLSVKEIEADIEYEVAFDEVGTKKLRATYAKLKKLN